MSPDPVPEGQSPKLDNSITVDDTIIEIKDSSSIDSIVIETKDNTQVPWNVRRTRSVYENDVMKI